MFKRNAVQRVFLSEPIKLGSAKELGYCIDAVARNDQAYLEEIRQIYEGVKQDYME